MKGKYSLRFTSMLVMTLGNAMLCAALFRNSDFGLFVSVTVSLGVTTSCMWAYLLQRNELLVYLAAACARRPLSFFTDEKRIRTVEFQLPPPQLFGPTVMRQPLHSDHRQD